MWQNKTNNKKNKSSSVSDNSIDFDCSIDFPDEHVGCIEADRAR